MSSCHQPAEQGVGAGQYLEHQRDRDEHSRAYDHGDIERGRLKQTEVALQSRLLARFPRGSHFVSSYGKEIANAERSISPLFLTMCRRSNFMIDFSVPTVLSVGFSNSIPETLSPCNRSTVGS